MDVDVVVLGAFVSIASVIVLTVWHEHRNAVEKEQRLGKVRRHV